MPARRNARLIDTLALPKYDLGPGHPFANDRQEPLFELLRETGLADDEDMLPWAPQDKAFLGLAHRDDYITAVRNLSETTPAESDLDDAARFGLSRAGDTPYQPGLHTAAAAVAGATRACVDAVLRGDAQAAFNPGGGLHHAMPGSASGFCVYNDLVVGIQHARANGIERVLYIDYDVHHGDGVEHAFAEDPNVVTVSFHQDPGSLWPGTGSVDDRGREAGKGYAINMPWAPGTTDASFTEESRTILTATVEAFRPGLILTQHGCDPHITDPLAEVSVGTGALLDTARLSKELADRVCDGRWVATGGGGYRPYSVLPRAWAMVWAVMADRDIPKTVPEAWRARWLKRDAAVPEQFIDAQPDDRRADAAARINAKSRARLLAGIPWLEQ